MRARGVIGHAYVGDDHGVDAELCCAVDRVTPQRELAGRRKRVDREQQLGLAGARIGERLLDLGNSEIQSGKIARIGLVLQAAIDGVGAGIDRGAQCRRRSGRADQLRALIILLMEALRLAHRYLPRTERTTDSASPAGPDRAPKLATTLSSAEPSKSSSALRSATTASVSPLTCKSREKNSASPSSEPSIMSSRLKNLPAMAAACAGRSWRRCAVSSGRSGSGVSTSTKGRSVGSIRKRFPACAPSRLNSSGRDCATWVAMRVNIGCSSASGTGASSTLGTFSNSVLSGDAERLARGGANIEAT